MDLVTGALGKLPSKLLELLKDEYKLQTGVKDQIRHLSRELTSMHEALDKVAKVPPDQLDKPVLLWACDVREASYDLEDIIDTFLVRVHGAPKEPAEEAIFGRFMKKVVELLSLSKIKARHEIAGAIDVISKHLEELEKLRQRYKVDGIVPKPAATTSIDPRLSAHRTKASQLVGIDEQRDKLIQKLTQGDQSMQPNQEETKIVSVVGVGGLGKTTLVKAVYEKLTMNIRYKAFVPVGQNPDLKKTLQAILTDLDKQRDTPVNIATLDERQLINELREFLRDKRYINFLY